LAVLVLKITKILKWIWISFLIICALLVLPFFISPIANNVALSIFSKQLYNIELPETTVLEKYSVLGKPNGNGNGMDFLACVLVETELTYEELKAEFESKNFKHAKPGTPLHYSGFKDGTYPIHTDVVKVDSGGELNTDYLTHPDHEMNTPRGKPRGIPANPVCLSRIMTSVA
jgi:hypothetical protein